MKTFQLPGGEYAIGRVRRRTLKVAAVVVGVALVALMLAPMTVLPTLIVAFIGVLALGLGFVAFPTRVKVGADGILLSWFGRHRFIPHRRIRNLMPYGVDRGGRVDLLLDDGQVVRLPTQRRSVSSRDVSAELAASIEEARSAAGPSEPSAPLIPRGPGERPRAFVARARRLLEDTEEKAAFRTPTLPIDALEAKLLDCHADPEERVGAALALRTQAGGLRAELVRIVADTTAHPALRIAVYADGADGGDEAVVRALDRLDERAR